MRGRVGEGAHEALLTLTVASLDPSGSQTELEAVVGTGFTGALCLGTEQIESLGLPLLGEELRYWRMVGRWRPVTTAVK